MHMILPLPGLKHVMLQLKKMFEKKKFTSFRKLFARPVTLYVIMYLVELVLQWQYCAKLQENFTM